MKVFLAGMLIASAAFGDAVTDWNAIMRSTVSGQNPLAQARFAAITHLAIFDAVNAITKNYKPYQGGIDAPRSASTEAAAVAAAYRVLRNYFPDAAATLDASRAQSLAMVPEGAGKSAGIAVGESVAGAMISKRATDGSGTAMPYTPPAGVGLWQPTPPAFAASTFLHWSKVMPFGIERRDQFRSKPPPKLTSREYRQDYEEVKDVGDALNSSRLQDRTDIARYASLTSPMLLWNAVAVQLSAAEEDSLVENARTFALMNMAIVDAGIGVFEAKFYYNFWRPVTAIRAGDRDGNPGTVGDPAFTPLIATPPYPGYPSGFGGLSSAARYVLEAIFGKTGHSIALSLPTLPGVTLRYTRLRQITDDIADARIYGGIHFRFDQDEAEVLGRDVARWVTDHHLVCAEALACEE